MYFFYLAYTDSHVKIGRTKDVKKEMSNLISNYSSKLTIIFRRETPEHNERALRERFFKHHVHHKWFLFDADIRIFVNQLEGRVKSKIKPYKEKEVNNLYLSENKEEKDMTFQEPVRIVKTTKVIDLPDLNSKDEWLWHDYCIGFLAWLLQGLINMFIYFNQLKEIAWQGMRHMIQIIQKPVGRCSMRSEVKAILKRLIEVRDMVQGFLDNAENSDYPNQDRIDFLDDELGYLDAAIENLNDIG